MSRKALYFCLKFFVKFIIYLLYKIWNSQTDSVLLATVCLQNFNDPSFEKHKILIMWLRVASRQGRDMGGKRWALTVWGRFLKILFSLFKDLKIVFTVKCNWPILKFLKLLICTGLSFFSVNIMFTKTKTQ